MACLLALILGGGALHALKPEKGFEALEIYDYFKAKQIFYGINAKKPDAYCSYGLAVIFSRHDNPFYNLDSAHKYIYQSYHAFMAKQAARKFQSFFIDNATILMLSDTVTAKQFSRVKKENSVSGFDAFLRSHYLGNKKLLHEAVYLRDELEFNTILQINKSDTTEQFMLLHPQSGFYSEAVLLKDRQIYDETTVPDNAESYLAFLEKYPKNMMVNTAYEQLFKIYRQRSDTGGLRIFVSNYPNAPQNIEAWKLLFSLTVKSFSDEELTRFLAEYPAFPLKSSILKELELNKLVLYPYQKGDYKGFIDPSGRFVINPDYDAATDFFEGLSVVSKNDSVFFINKENTNVFEKVYSDASVFKNGIAPVKENGKWYFINRQGQTISKTYDEINELSNAVYVVKLRSKYGALDQFGQVILEPKFDKLGDFKNGYAYYMETGNYGFVSKSGTVHKAEFEWISDFNNEQIAVVRQNNRYGLINTLGQRILDARYSQVIPADSGVFVVVLDGSYGFFSSAGCFIKEIAYEFQEKPADFYTNGNTFKLLKKGDQALVDKNGHIEISFGAYDEISFASQGLIRVKRKNKYGYLDQKLSPAIALKYQQAADFSDSLALVKLKDKYIMINIYGHEVFSTSAPVEKLSSHYYTIDDGDVKHIIDRKGAGILNDAISIQKAGAGLFIITLENGDIKLLND